MKSKYEYKVEDFLNALFDDEKLNNRFLDVHHWQNPHLLFFGDVPKERKEIVIDVDKDFIDNFEKNIAAIFDEINRTLSYRIKDEDNLLTDDHVRLMDHIYGIMIHIFTDNNYDEDNFMTRLGLLTVETDLECMSDMNFLGDVVFAQHSSLMEKAAYQSVSQTLYDLSEDYELHSRLLFDCPNISYSFVNQGSSYYPFINHDFQFGGQLGFYRLKSVIDNGDFDLSFNNLVFKEKLCKKNLNEKFDRLYEALDVFKYMIDDSEKKKVSNLIRNKKEYYKL